MRVPRAHERASVAVTTLAPVPSGESRFSICTSYFCCPARCTALQARVGCSARKCGNQREHIELPAIGSRGEDRDARCVEWLDALRGGGAADDGVSEIGLRHASRCVARARSRGVQADADGARNDSDAEGLGQCFEKEADAKRAARLKLMSRRPTWPHATDPIIADSHVKELEQSIKLRRCAAQAALRCSQSACSQCLFWCARRTCAAIIVRCIIHNRRCERAASACAT